MAVTTAWTEREIAWLFVLAGFVVVAVAASRLKRRPAPVSSTPLIFALAVPSLTTHAAASLSTIFWFFVKAGAFVFGSGLAIVPFLYGEVVQTNQWLSDREFLDAVAVAMITPGPVVITVAFIGYLMAGFWGMTTAAVGVFLPVYLLVVIPASSFRRHRSQPTVKAFVDGVSAAATGAIAGAAYVLGTRALTDAVTAAIAVITFVVLSKWKISELWPIAGAAVLGLLIGA
jgi:chromate transporter